MKKGRDGTVVEGVKNLSSEVVVKTFNRREEEFVGNSGLELDFKVGVGKGEGLVYQEKVLKDGEGARTLIDGFERGSGA